MIRLASLQARAQTLVALAGLAAVAAVALATGPYLVHLYDTTVAPCTSHGDCPTAIPAFLGHDSTLRTWLGVLVVVAPGVIGIFWGAPLVAQELETGTLRLAWSQSVTRTRWLAVKLALVGLAGIAIVGLLSLTVTWWANPLDRAHAGRYVTFDQRDLVPVGYAALAFSLGVTAGMIVRRTLPAMVSALAAFVAARIAVTEWLRPHLLTPVHASVPVASAPDLGFGSSGPTQPVTLMYGTPSIRDSWVLSSRIVDNAGRPVTTEMLHRFLTAACPGVAAPRPLAGSLSHAPANPQIFDLCLGRVSAHYHLSVTYQPASHYWPLQWYETGIFLIAAAAVAGLGGWLVRR
jgi:hypothetical protein